MSSLSDLKHMLKIPSPLIIFKDILIGYLRAESLRVVQTMGKRYLSLEKQFFQVLLNYVKVL